MSVKKYSYEPFMMSNNNNGSTATSDVVVDDDLLEYSVIYTDRAKNLMSSSFSQAFKDISNELCDVYKADHCVLIPGSGSYAMEAVLGQFVRPQTTTTTTTSQEDTSTKYAPSMVIRNGYFSFRWSDIFDHVFPSTCGRSPELKVIPAVPVDMNGKYKPAFEPPSVETVVKQIHTIQPCVVFAPHVETSDGMILSKEYIQTVANAVHTSGCEDAIFVLDCIASGNMWIDMKALGVDIVITAPQKGWTSPACVGIVMMSDRAKTIMHKQKVRGHSFCCNLSKWSTVADTYMATPGGFMYHTTLPTDSLMTFRNVIMETKAVGLEYLETQTVELGKRIRTLLESKGFVSVAAKHCQAPTVVVSYMRDEKDDKTIAAKFKKYGIQIAAGVPLKINEPWANAPTGPPTFRIGLFGLDKLQNVDKAVKVFEDALEKVLADKE